MSFLLFLFFLFVIYFIIWPILKTLFFVNKVRKNFYNNFKSANQRHGNQRKPSGKADSRKIINKDIGEYVRYQEIPNDAAEYKETKDENTVSKDRQENQIEDIEWTDI